MSEDKHNFINLTVDGRGRLFKIHLLGTSHASEESIQEVEDLIQEVNPDVVLIELDYQRQPLLNPDFGKEECGDETEEKEGNWLSDIRKMMKDAKEKKRSDSQQQAGILSVLMAAVSKSLIKSMKVDPSLYGGDMRTAARLSDEMMIPCVLGDLPISILFSRMWGELGVFERYKLIFGLLWVILFGANASKEEIEAIKNGDLNELLKELAETYPSLTRVILHQRNEYLASTLWNTCMALSPSWKMGPPPVSLNNPFTLLTFAGLSTKTPDFTFTDDSDSHMDSDLESQEDRTDASFEQTLNTDTDISKRFILMGDSSQHEKTETEGEWWGHLHHGEAKKMERRARDHGVVVGVFGAAHLPGLKEEWDRMLENNSERLMIDLRDLILKKPMESDRPPSYLKRRGIVFYMCTTVLVVIISVVFLLGVLYKGTVGVASLIF